VAADGATTESKSEVVTAADGAKTETLTATTVAADGATTETNKEVVTTAEGVTTSTETVKATTAEGTSAEKVTTVDETGAATTTVAAAIPTEVATVAAASGEAVTIPVEVSASKDTQTAPTITVDLPAEAGEVKVEIPVTDVTPGTVAVIVHEDGTEEIVKASALTEDGMTVALTGGATIKIVDNSKTFDDMADDHWANNAVSFVSAREIFHGTGNNSFSSEGTMTRGMIAQVLYNLDGAPEVNGNNGLTDVADSAWYSTAANWAVEAGISSGNGEGGFDPEADVTREQLAIMLWRYAGQPEATQTELPFDDADQTSSYAQAALLWANEVGIMKGRGDGTLDPQGISTRAEVAQMLMNFIQK
jgi:hypothetical protein